MKRLFLHALLGCAAIAAGRAAQAQEIPRPEHPRPMTVREHWANLNGTWEFRFDPKDEGQAAGWYQPGAEGFDRKIVVPFPWESELSGIKDTSGASKVGWYRRTFRVPEGFPSDHRLWLRFEAVDWQADVWVNGQKVASHEGGYTPFEADVTDAVRRDGENVLVVRAFDPTDPSLPTGKQIGWYTTTSGIWQTVWLESRPRVAIPPFRVTTTLEQVTFEFPLADVAAPEGDQAEYRLSVTILDENDNREIGHVDFRPGASKDAATLSYTLPGPKLWTPESPHLYNTTIELKDKDGKLVDSIQTYFGLRTIARGKYGDEPFERILLNGKPVYLRGALDQSFNPKGIYTAPSDEFLKQDILWAKRLGLNFLRIHIKSEEPRRLYWADRIGMLIMQDMPNTWQQNARARQAWETTMRETILRDRNHPSIFAWVAFNETWGLGAPDAYKANKDTQDWVKRMVAAIRELDPTRLVEDNSPCNYDHVNATDLNSWHFYIDDHEAARKHIEEVVAKSEPGSSFNYCPGELMNSAPLINSEYGAVSAGGGDRDVSWGFRDLTTQLRKHNKIQGYIYTELSDIEWEHNGFLNYDRTPKVFGYDHFLPDMSVIELQQPDFVGYDAPPAIIARPGETITVPVFISHYSDREHVKLRWWLQGWDDRANIIMASPPKTIDARWEPYKVTWQEPIKVKVPDHPFVGALILTLRDPVHPPGQVDPRFAVNYVNVVVKPEKPLPRVERRNDHDAVLRFTPGEYHKARWSGPIGTPPGKVHGQGRGYFEYLIKVPEAVVKARPQSITLRFEAGAKAGRELVDWPERVNAQDYPQTDGRKWPTTVAVSLNGTELARDTLESDRADARGVLSHLNRIEHGSHGDLVEVIEELPEAVRRDLAAGKPLVIRIAVPEDANPAGGLAIFGADTGLFPLDPTIELTTAQTLPADLGVDPAASVVIDPALARQVDVLRAGDSNQGPPAEWAYTTTDPGRGWEAPEFDDSSWQRGTAGFGTPETPALQERTRWNTPDIWMRTTVEMPELRPDDVLSLHLFHDEEVTVYVNGKRLFRAGGYVTAYQDVRLGPEQSALFRAGRNTVAVRCHQTGGGQGVDLGIKLLRADD